MQRFMKNSFYAYFKCSKQLNYSNQAVTKSFQYPMSHFLNFALVQMDWFGLLGFCGKGIKIKFLSMLNLRTSFAFYSSYLGEQKKQIVISKFSS